MDITKLSIAEKVGQKFMFGVNSSNIDIVINLIKKYAIGGVILYKKNYSNYKEMLSVVKKLKEANKDNKIPLFIAIDQEGGRVNRMPSEINIIKNIYDMSKKDKKLVYENGFITGHMLYKTGINMNFAPVLDIGNENKNNVLYKRCFCGDINDVSSRYIKGLQENNVISVIKHFPGHGISTFDSHIFTPYIFNYKKVLNYHIKPFEYSIEKGIDALMVAHLSIRKLTDGLPASISKKFISEYIRDKFDGVIITDEINMLSRNILYRLNYMKHLVNSGSDIILVKIKHARDMHIIDKYINYVNSKCFDEKILDDSVNRIIKLKKKYNINDDINYDGFVVGDVNKKIDKINSLC